MKTLSDLKPGDKVGIRDNGKAYKVHPIIQITKDSICLPGLGATMAFTLDGKAYGHRSKALRLDPDWQTVQSELDEAKLERDAIAAKRDALRSSPEYKLANELINSAEPEISMEAFSKLGMEKLNQIKTWLNS